MARELDSQTEAERVTPDDQHKQIEGMESLRQEKHLELHHRAIVKKLRVAL